MTEPIRLRPHHMLCLRFFSGKGYRSEFISNMAQISAALQNDSSKIVLIDGCDDICTACPNSDGEKCESHAKSGLYDSRCLALTGFSPGQVLTWRQLCESAEKNILSPGRLSEICGDCCWSGICGSLV